jgi:predicted nuclease of predicted toxin-antitoxin system
MSRFLIDVNLPYYFSLWRGDSFVHQFDLGDEWTDNEIWEYAKTHDLVVVTKDADFSDRIIFHAPPPKVIHIRVGNMRMKEFFLTLTRRWPEAVELIETNKLVSIYPDRVEAIE